MFRRRKKRKRKGTKGENSESDGSATDTDRESDTGDAECKKEWGKKVEDALRRYIEACTCRRNVADDYFENTPRRQGKSFILNLNTTSSLYMNRTYRDLLRSMHRELGERATNSGLRLPRQRKTPNHPRSYHPLLYHSLDTFETSE